MTSPARGSKALALAAEIADTVNFALLLSESRVDVARRREEIGCSYFVVGADFADAVAPVVAELAKR